MDSEERRALIRMALGKASMAFMTQPTGGEIVMPTEELLEVAEDIHAIWALEVDALAAEVRELRAFKQKWSKYEAERWRSARTTFGDAVVDAAMSARGEEK